MNIKKAEMKDRLQEALEMREKKAVDLVKDLKIPKSAISQYLSGKSQKMDSARLYAICRYLDVDEPWLLGYDVPIKKHNDYVVSLSKNQDLLIEFAKTVPEEKAGLVLRVMKSILEGTE